jgi:predicted dehydrogenase
MSNEEHFMESLPKLKVGQAGVARFGEQRRKTLRETGLFDLAAVYDYVPERLAEAASEQGAGACDSYEELLDFPGLEGIVISTGAKFHAAQVLAAAERGLHVFVEKPLCSTPEEMHALLECRQRTGVVIGVGHSDHRADGLARTLKRLIDSGELGAVAAFETTTAHNGGMLMAPTEWRADPAKNPGGMLFQCGVHSLHELRFLFGEIREVSCFLRYDVHTSATADVALCLLRFANGVVGTLQAYHVVPYRHTLNIMGTKANVYMRNQFFAEGVHLDLQVTHFDGEYEPLVPLAIDASGEPYGEVRSWFHGIREGTPVYPDLLDGARAVAAVFAADESARKGGCAVAVPEDLT